MAPSLACPPFANDAATSIELPAGDTLSGAPTSCEGGSCNNSLVIPGGCTETDRLTGTFLAGQRAP